MKGWQGLVTFVMVATIWAGVAQAAVIKEGQKGFALTLTDQYGQAVEVPPEDTPAVVVLSDKEGAAQSEAWGAALAKAFAQELKEDPPTLKIIAVAHLKGVPAMMRGMVKGFFLAAADQPAKPPVALDWEGSAAAQTVFKPGVAQVLVLDRDGVLRLVLSGAATEKAVAQVTEKLKGFLE